MAGSGVYSYLPQEKVIFGTAADVGVAEEVQRIGAQRVLIVASKSLTENAKTVADIKAALGDACAGLFTGCIAHSPRPTIIAAADAVRDADADLIVSVGGGTVFDTVKILQLCLAGDVHDVDGMDRIRLIDGVKPDLGASPVRQIAVPTTLSGAEFSNLGASTDPKSGEKQGYMGDDICPRSVILDPAATLATPDWLWLSTGIRAVDHAVETLCGSNPNAFCDGLSLHALRLLADGLRRSMADPSDLAARQMCQEAVWLASSSIMRVMYGASHGIGHALGGLCGVPHGHTSCIMLPHVMRWNLEVTAAPQKLIADALGRPGLSAADAVSELITDLDQPTTLHEVGVRQDQLREISDMALSNLFVRTNPRKIDHADQILEILEHAW